MDNIKYIFGIILGICLAVIFGTKYVTQAFEYNQAYKFPSKIVKKKEYVYIEKKTDKKETVVATGNAKEETKPDGSKVLTGDKIEKKTEEETTEKKTVKKAEEETSKPILPVTDKGAFLYLNIGQCILIDANIMDPTKTISANLENFSIGATINLKPNFISIDYQHLYAHPDLIMGKVSIPIF